MTTATLDIADIARTGIPGYDPWRDAGDCTFDEEAAILSCDFFAECIQHVEGHMAGRPYILEPHEAGIVANIMGWKRPDGTRRYRTCFFYVPRGNSKTTFAAGFVLMIGFIDNEPGAQLVSTASARDQAKHIYRIAEKMIMADPDLHERCRAYPSYHSITIAGQGYKALAAEAGTAHGQNIHLAVNDETHTHKHREFLDVIDTSLGKRLQPIRLDISTADYVREGSVCNEMRDYAVAVRDGVVDDPYFLPVIYEISPEEMEKDPDCWKDPEMWARVNPMLGKAIPHDYFERQFKKALGNPSFENEFKRLHLNIRTESSERMISSEAWAKCGGAFDSERFKGQRCFAGLDLGNTSDLTSLCLMFKDEGIYYALWWHWMPQDKARDKERKHEASYTAWARDGWLTFTPGNETDYQRVRADINAIAEDYGIEQLAADRLFQGAQLCQDLASDGFNVVEFGQGFLSMAAPTNEFMKLVGRGEFQHGDNPLMNWQASNAAAKMDQAGNIKPDKKASGNKIDGIVAAIMGLAPWMKDEGPKQSVYETRGVRYV